MKFLCPSCKAKYQIADEKVAGRSVRMKCRKCGYVIQVSSVTGLGDALPGSEPPPAIAERPSEAPSAPASVESAGLLSIAPLAPAAPPTAAATALASPADELPEPPLPTAPAARAVPAAVPRSTLPRPATVRSPLAAARPTPSIVRPAPPTSGGKAPLPAARSTLPTAKPLPARSSLVRPGVPPTSSGVQPSPVADRPSAQTGAAKALPAVASRPLSPRPSDVRPTSMKPAEPEPSVEPSRPTASEVKPVEPQPVSARPAELSIAAEAAAPLASDTSAVALAATAGQGESSAFADGSALAGAFSLAVGSPSDAPGADAANGTADEWFVGINGVPVGPIRLTELRSKAGSGSVNGESLVWRDGFEDWRPLKTFPELMAIVDESLSSVRASLTPFTPPVATSFVPAIAALGAEGVAAAPAAVNAMSDPFATAAAGVTGAAMVTEDLEAAGVQRRGGSSPAAWIAVGMALLFGLTIGFVLFNRQKTVEVVKYVDRPVPATSGAAPDVVHEKITSIDEANIEPDGKTLGKHPNTAPKASAAPGASAEPDKLLKNGLPNLLPAGPHGPDVSGPSGTTQGTGQLDGGQIQSTVARYTGSVKRACWQPALDTRDKDAPTTARVNVAITVLPSGSVQSASVGADPKGYRGLSQCISSRVHGWQFPPSGDSTTVNVPFVFAAQ